MLTCRPHNYEENIINISKWKNKKSNTNQQHNIILDNHFVNIPDKIKLTRAYRDLSNSAKLVLFDMISQHNRQTFHSNPKNIFFHYNYKDCIENISKNTFEDSIKQILNNGWFDCEKINRTGERIFKYSCNWKKYK